MAQALIQNLDETLRGMPGTMRLHGRRRAAWLLTTKLRSHRTCLRLAREQQERELAQAVAALSAVSQAEAFLANMDEAWGG